MKSIADTAGNIFSWLLIKLVRLYQLAISPYIGSNCRHQPTCSNYMIDAVKVWGPLKGTWLGLRRIGKCHPWGTTGYDPVPEKNNPTDQQ